jgi:hypothetical protein
VSDRNGSDCKYVEIFAHRVGSIGASSRRTVFIRGTKTKQLEVPKTAGRNTKASIFQKGSAGFETTIDPEKKMHQGLVSVYVKFVDLISLKHQCRYMEREGKNCKNRRTQTSAGCAQAYWHQSK